jgi:hypothetical protein
MDIKTFLLDFLLVFAITLVVSIIVTFLWSLAFHNLAVIDWETSFSLAIIIGIIIPIVNARDRKKAKN